MKLLKKLFVLFAIQSTSTQSNEMHTSSVLSNEAYAEFRKICQNTNKPFAIANWIPEFGLALNIKKNAINAMPAVCKTDPNAKLCTNQLNKISSKHKNPILKKRMAALLKEHREVIVSIKNTIQTEANQLLHKEAQKLHKQVLTGALSEKQGDQKITAYNNELTLVKTQIENNLIISLDAELAKKHTIGTCGQIAAHNAINLVRQYPSSTLMLVKKTSKHNDSRKITFMHTYLELENGTICDSFNNGFFGQKKDSMYEKLDTLGFDEAKYWYAYLDPKQYPKSMRRFIEKYDSYRSHPDNVLDVFSERCLEKEHCISSKH